MRRHLLKLLALTAALAVAPASASVMLSPWASAPKARCPHERAKVAAPARAAAQRPQGATTITLSDRMMDEGPVLHFGQRAFFAP